MDRNMAYKDVFQAEQPPQTPNGKAYNEPPANETTEPEAIKHILKTTAYATDTLKDIL